MGTDIKFDSFDSLLSGLPAIEMIGLKVLLALAALCLPAEMAFTSCPSPDVMENFDLKPYLGTWYEMERNYNPAESSARKCVRTTIKPLNETGYNVHFNLTWVVNNVFESQVVKGRYNAAEQSAKLKIKPIPLFPKQNYWVIDSDYTNYAVVWSCAEFYLNHYQLIWIFSRKSTLRPEYRFKAYQALQKVGLKLEDLVVVDHAGCY